MIFNRTINLNGAGISILNIIINIHINEIHIYIYEKLVGKVYEEIQNVKKVHKYEYNKKI